MAFRILGIRCSDLKIHCTFVCLLAHNLLYNSFLFQIAYAYGAAVLIIWDLDWICFRIVVNLVYMWEILGPQIQIV